MCWQFTRNVLTRFTSPDPTAHFLSSGIDDGPGLDLGLGVHPALMERDRRGYLDTLLYLAGCPFFMSFERDVFTKDCTLWRISQISSPALATTVRKAVEDHESVASRACRQV